MRLSDDELKRAERGLRIAQQNLKGSDFSVADRIQMGRLASKFKNELDRRERKRQRVQERLTQASGPRRPEVRL